ncbi:aspartate/glutamate racemase family protein [Exiguobacterium aestuarii]|uniref:Aspartate/glutamate racemase family protein n=1 Tax=Exiguobacterium aestuarii TaxID=273527 RepID=A0ABW2PNM9_9BACL|nr:MULTISPECIES: aspartate/glutamate racemase family protein [Exiguobacterium]MCT4785900.1 aspartate/glutamate racemase family protein [Exiguobacterium aestuarii]
MKKIGMLGGMSWESSLEYYRIMNEEVKSILGGTHSANCLLHSFDFHRIERLQHEGNWDELTRVMIHEALNLKKAGAELIVICTNTMHLMADAIEVATSLPVLHIADVTGQAIRQENLKKVALLGTRFTMESSFYRDLLKERYEIELMIPNEEDRQRIHDIIYDELIFGITTDESRLIYTRIIESLQVAGAEGVILGCTEIPLLIQQQHVSIPLFDTTYIHATAAVRKALEQQ